MRRFPVLAVLPILLIVTTRSASHAADALPPTSPGVARPAVSLVWFDPAGALPVPMDVAAAEVAALFTAWDIDVQWRLGEAGVTVTETHEIQVVLQTERRAGRPDILGEVQRGGNVQAVWVSVAAVARVLGHAYLPGRAVRDTVGQELATAIARVVTHEIAHLAAPDLPHTSQGLMRHSLGRRELLAKAPTLEGGTQQGFRARIAAFAAGDPTA
jgi:hypothetical protein